MVNVLAFLFEKFLHKQIDIQAHMEQIAQELPKVGFKVDDIDGALDWLDETFNSQQFDEPSLKNCNAQRIFTALEKAKLNCEARGMLYFLENSGLTTPAVRELLIERAMALHTNFIGKEEMRWVILFVMMNTHARQNVVEWIEANIKKI